MNKILKSVLSMATVSLLMVSFNATAQDKKVIKTEASTVTWKGYKVTGAHEGTIDLKSGSLDITEDKLTGGEFVINMGSLISTDLEGESKGKLEGHLKSDDFFGVEKFPTAKLVFKTVKSTGKNSYEVVGDITIKGKTEAVTLDVSVYGSKANAALKIDRTKFDVRYGSASFFDDLKDKAIYDDFDLIVDLEF